MRVRIAIYGKARIISTKSQTVGTMDVPIDKKSRKMFWNFLFKFKNFKFWLLLIFDYGIIVKEKCFWTIGSNFNSSIPRYLLVRRTFIFYGAINVRSVSRILSNIYDCAFVWKQGDYSFGTYTQFSEINIYYPLIRTHVFIVG